MGSPLDQPLPPDDRFSVDVARFVDGRPDPSTNARPPENPPVDVIALLEAEERLASVFG
jgi:hypothetical protein